jgi:hypothetical protein
MSSTNLSCDRASMTFVCEDCGDSFAIRLRLYKHRLEKHKNEKHGYMCVACTDGFSTRTQLLHHTKNTHRFVRSCTFCPEAFKKSETKRIHEGDKHAVILPWKRYKLNLTCSFCPQVFGNLGYLAKHMIQFHDYATLFETIERFEQLK